MSVGWLLIDINYFQEKKVKIVRLLLLIGLSGLLFGCASGAKVENMAYTEVRHQFDTALEANIGVKDVSGGTETNPLWISEISNDAFRQAVRDSLSSQGLLAEQGNYDLMIQLIEVNQPIMGFDLTVTTHIRYVLTDKTRNTVVMDEMIITPHTATMEDAFAAIKRLRLANEGAARKNIESLLDKLSQLQIAPSTVSLVE
jgi:hypothetical protein